MSKRDVLADLADYTDTPPEQLDSRRWRLLVDEAIAVIRAVKPSLPEEIDGWPDNARTVLLRVLARGMDTPTDGVGSGVESVSESGGPFSYSLRFNEHASGNRLWLSKQDKVLLGVRGGAYSIDLIPRSRPRRERGWTPL